VKLPDSYADHGVSGWSGDGRFILITGADYTLWVWDVRKSTARPVKANLEISDRPVDLSRDGHRLALLFTRDFSSLSSWIIGLPSSLRPWAVWCYGKLCPRVTRLSVQEIATGTELGATTIENDWIGSLALSPDGSVLAASDHRGRVLLYDVPGRGR
jgi:WD40 repeat protein